MKQRTAKPSSALSHVRSVADVAGICLRTNEASGSLIFAAVSASFGVWMEPGWILSYAGERNDKILDHSR